MKICLTHKVPITKENARLHKVPDCVFAENPSYPSITVDTSFKKYEPPPGIPMVNVDGRILEKKMPSEPLEEKTEPSSSIVTNPMNPEYMEINKEKADNIPKPITTVPAEQYVIMPDGSLKPFSGDTPKRRIIIE